MLITLIVILLSLIGSSLNAATLYIDASMGADCTSGNYSIANRNCTGSDGNGYNDVQAAYAASATNDTINLRTGTITSNASNSFGIFVKQGQTWQTYPGDMPSRATLTTVTHTRIFQVECVTAATVKNLILVGGIGAAIFSGYATNYVLEGNDVSGNNTLAANETHQFSLGDTCGDNCLGGGCPAFSANAIIRGNVFHDPAFKHAETDNACISASLGSSGFLIEDNICSENGMGFWSDVDGGNPTLSGRSRHTVRNNIVHDIDEYCYHIEARSSWVMYNNVGYNCGKVGVFSRQAGTITNTEIYNNTFWRCGKHCIGFAQHDNGGDIDTATGLKIHNNLMAADDNVNHVMLISARIAADATNSFKNNLIFSSLNDRGVCWQQGTGSGFDCIGESYADDASGISSWQAQCAPATCTGNVVGSPLFTSAAGADFTLLAGSPAINAGETIATVTDDFNGIARPQGGAYDIGAFESAVTTRRSLAPVILSGVLE